MSYSLVTGVVLDIISYRIILKQMMSNGATIYTVTRSKNDARSHAPFEGKRAPDERE